MAQVNMISKRQFKNLIQSTAIKGCVVAGFDVGTAKTGIALSDTMFLRANPLTTIKMKPLSDFRDTSMEILRILEKHQVAAMVVGWPMHLENVRTLKDTKHQKMCLHIDAFLHMFHQHTKVGTLLPPTFHLSSI